VGGGIYMNAGCHGAEFAEIVTEVTLMDPKGKVKQLSRKQISFSIARATSRALSSKAKLGLGEESPAKLKELQGKLLRWRKAGTRSISRAAARPSPIQRHQDRRNVDR